MDDGVKKLYCYEYPSAGTRLAILEETVQVVRALWSDATVTFGPGRSIYAGGCTTFDTAPHYGNGRSEQRFGALLRKRFARLRVV